MPAVIETTTPWEFAKAQKALLRLMGHGEFACGSQFTLADVLLAHTVSWAASFKFEVDGRLLAYKKRMYERAACGRARS